MKVNEPHLKKNRGAVLLVFVLITIIISSTLLLKALTPQTAHSELLENGNVLFQAKQALIGYAISYSDRNPNRLPGYLPCPDFDGDGLADAPCGLSGQSSFGRLPWKTLGLKVLRDSANECLWYAVSGAYKESPAGDLAPGADGQLLLFDSDLNSLNGINNRDAGIAIILSSGSSISGQNRTSTPANTTECASTLTSDSVRSARQYFETRSDVNNANGSYSPGTILGLTVSAIPSINHSTFINANQLAVAVPTVINDNIIKITQDDFDKVYPYMQRYIGNRVRQCLNNYASSNGGQLPWPAILSPPSMPSYIDNASNRRFGRIASSLINTAADGLSAFWPMDPVQPTIRCFNWDWWSGVRESVFMAITDPSTPQLKVDGVNTSALILVAGRKNVTQDRSSGNDKGTISNYLESANVIDSGTGAIPPGDEAFITIDTANPSFNDYVCNLSSCP